MKRQVTNPAELRDLNRQLLQGLELYLERNHKMFKSKKQDGYSIENLASDLDAAIAKAAVAFVDSHRIVDLLESRIATIARRQAINYSLAPRVVSGNL